ncbi:MAG: hypothetical protein WKG32_22915 [Gemmatimonadaceae bacterium]
MSTFSPDDLTRGLELTPDQLAELRAIGTMYQRERYALAQREPGDVGAPPDALMATVIWRVRAMLRDEQRPAFDRNVEAWRTGGDIGPARHGGPRG